MSLFNDRYTALTQPAGDLTFAEFIPIYVEGYCRFRNLRSYDGERRFKIGKIGRSWNARLLRDLRVSDVTLFLADLKRKGAASSTVRRYYSLIHQMFNWAESQGYLAQNPIRKGSITLEAEDNERTRRLLPEEEQKILVHADDYLRDVLCVALDVGLRMGTIRQLQFEHVRPALGRFGAFDIPARVLKQKRRQVLPMTQRVRDVVDRRQTRQGGLSAHAFIFGTEAGVLYRSSHSIRARWIAALTAAGLKDANLHFHDLRGEAASRLADLGVPLATIQRFLGHSSLVMTQRYLRARVSELDDAIGVLDHYVNTEDKTGTFDPNLASNNVDGNVARSFDLGRKPMLRMRWQGGAQSTTTTSFGIPRKRAVGESS